MVYHNALSTWLHLNHGMTCALLPQFTKMKRWSLLEAMLIACLSSGIQSQTSIGQGPHGWHSTFLILSIARAPCHNYTLPTAPSEKLK
ncbi:conserved hypothetical protein [Ricinus communis]|uniref:Uncharacterized protein n=1 Tax=Ricinus communis TaxID=3988 RepID=B9RS76_RICCO|nr:conserved hypothetical protein [Ricinus communis]